MGPSFPTSPGRFLWHYVMRRPGLSICVSTIVVAGAASAVGLQYSMKLLIDALSAPDHHLPTVWRAGALFLGLIALENVFWRIGGWLGSKTVVTIGGDIRLDLFQHLIGHASRYFSEHLGGALANRITATGTAASAALATLIWNIIPPTADLVGSVLVLGSVDWRIACALLVAATLVSIFLGRLGVRGRAVHAAYFDRSAAVSGDIVDVLSNNWIVKVFSGRNREARRLRKNLQIEAIVHMRSWMFVERMRVLHDLMLWLIAAGILCFSILRWSDGSITTGDIVLIAAVTLRILNGSRDLALSAVSVGQNLGAVREALGVIGLPHEIADHPEALRLDTVRGAIRFERVNFSYPDRENLFSGFDLAIPAGQSVGIVGPSGAGKSTLIRLVQRLETATAGRVLIDGHAIDRISEESLKAALAVVPQDISLFNRTVIDNIRYGRPMARDEEVVEAAMAARCHDFIQALPDGYRTRVGDRGVKLSGGQRQRLGIARAILKKSPIIIFDEATSSLDSESELEIQLALARLSKDRTVLAVAHRLSTVAGFDRILFLQDGAVLEDSAPSELYRQDGPFARMWRLQTEGLSSGASWPTDVAHGKRRLHGRRPD